MQCPSVRFQRPVSGDRFLKLAFLEPMSCLSWAILGGGLVESREVIWLEFSNAELPPDLDPAGEAKKRLLQMAAPDAVTFLTSHPVGGFLISEKAVDDLACRCIATVGLGNGRRIGDAPGIGRVGTINILVELSHKLSFNTMLETLSLVAEARTCACIEANLPSPISGLPITGTGTDCICIASPQSSKSEVVFAGKHTTVGWLVGETVMDAVCRGIQIWMDKGAES